MSTSALPEISGAEFIARILGGGDRFPFEGTVETTFRCNLNCVHCYVNLPAADAAAREREVPTERLLSLVDEIADAGTMTLLLTGGEVLVRPDFAEVYRHAVGRGLRVVVFTNATMVTDRVVELFAEMPPALVEVTLYGGTEETYDRVTRVPGSFRRCLDGIRKLHARGIRLGLKTTVIRENVDELPRMQAIADELGLSFRWDADINARVDCGAPRGEQQVDAARIVALDLASPKRTAALRKMLAGAAEAPRDLPLYDCGAGRVGFTVDPYGQLQLCQTSRRNGYDLRTGTFHEGWGTHLRALSERSWQTSSVCRACSLRIGCGNCPGAAELATGTPEGVVGAFCRVTHERAFAVNAGVPGHVRDASCCLGAGAGEAPVAACGGCAHGAPDDRIQLQRRTPRAARP